ncbi:MAG: rhomboid family intramembrane serine protease [Actinomycetota bacterium]
MIPISDENPTHRPPVVTILLIVASVVVFFGVQPQNDTQEDIRFTFEYAAIPCELSSGEPLSIDEVLATLDRGDDRACGTERDGDDQVFPDKNVWLAVVISMFLHGSLLHLGGNMLFLWIFGNNIEDHLGHVRYLLFYLLSGGVATGAHAVMQLDSTVPLIGASGAVAGVMGAYLVWFPRARVRTFLFLGFIFLFPRIPAWVMLSVWFVSQFFIGPDEGIAWLAHVGGFVFGAIVGVATRHLVTARPVLPPQHPDRPIV